MYTWKTIPSSDYSIRTFNTYKNWTFVSGSDVLLLSASNTIIYNDSNTIEFTNGFSYNPHSLYGQLSASFYSLIDTPIAKGIRKLENSAKVFSIPNEYIGETIKPGSVTVTDSSTNVSLTDNASGSLISASVVVGDIFYEKGIIVYTYTNDINNIFNNNWQVQFKSTQTITEHEIFVSVDKDEFNISRNPTALVKEEQQWYTLSSSLTSAEQRILVDEGIQYIRKKSSLPNGNIVDLRYGSKITAGVSGGFEHYEISASVDPTGSFLTPFATSIGLYDRNNTLVAIAKLPKPIKIESSLPINFIVRFDV
jgi:hypothetical protein